MLPFLTIVTFGILVCSIIYFVRKQNRAECQRFEQKGILYLGNGNLRFLMNAIFGRGLNADAVAQYSKLKSAGVKIGGSTDYGVTTLTVADTDLLKSVLVKDFEHFVDRRLFKLGPADYLIKKMVALVTGEKWKQLRTKLSPTFTTGKIKRMFSLFDQSGRKLVKFYENEIRESKNGEIDLSEGFSKFTMDIIASAACGIDSEAFKQKKPSLFERMGKAARVDFTLLTTCKMYALAFLPESVINFLQIGMFSKNAQDFFHKAVKDVVKERESSGERRDDFVQLMIEARSGTLKSEETEVNLVEKSVGTKASAVKTIDADLLNDEGIAANCLIFVLAGYDTTQAALIFAAYNLALHQNLQDKLRAEVDSIFMKNNGNITYDALNEMTYLDMVINETLRMYPPAPVVDRICTADYKIPKTDFILKKGEVVSISVYGLHHDPEYFPEPEKFDPERFSAKNRHQINQYAFLPFGQGPRNCIGMRFALAEVKVVLAYLVRNFRIEPSARTPIPMKFGTSITLNPVGGMYLSLKKIEDS